MTQNRNQLIEHLIGNLSNYIIHSILEKSNTQYKEKYAKEGLTIFEISKKYREKINPLNNPFPITDIKYIKDKITKRATAELSLRIFKGYKDIDLSLINLEIDKILKNLNIT